MGEEKTLQIWDFDRIASCCAIFTAVVALAVAIYEARVTRKHQEISVWPSLTWYNTSLAKIGDEYYNFGTYIKNDGIGPAIIKKISYKYNGKDYFGQRDIIKEVLPEKKDSIFATDKSVIRVILPGKDIMLVATNFTKSEMKKFRSVATGKIKGQVCYCSLYESCWLLDSSNPSKPVESCD